MPDLTEKQLNDMLERAAEIGAQKALAKVGLSDDAAGTDVRALRNLLGAWRTTTKTVLTTTVRWATIAILTMLAIGFWAKTGHVPTDLPGVE